MVKKYIVKNKTNERKKFRDGYTGAFVEVSPGEEVETFSPPQSGENWEVFVKTETPTKDSYKDKIVTVRKSKKKSIEEKIEYGS